MQIIHTLRTKRVDRKLVAEQQVGGWESQPKVYYSENSFLIPISQQQFIQRVSCVHLDKLFITIFAITPQCRRVVVSGHLPVMRIYLWVADRPFWV